jgi:hypothetical protein
VAGVFLSAEYHWLRRLKVVRDGLIDGSTGHARVCFND